MKEKKESWYVYAILSLVAGALAYLAFSQYESFLHPSHPGSGKGGKFLLLILNGIDVLGGKWFVLVCLTAISAYYLWKCIRQLRSSK